LCSLSRVCELTVRNISFLEVQFPGGCARTLANLSVLEDETERGVFDLSGIITDKSMDDVVYAWADLRRRSLCFL
jgi:hypothetical protein